MKKFFIITILFAICMGLMGCRVQNDPDNPNYSGSSKPKEKEYYVKYCLDVTSGNIGSGSYVIYKQASGITSTDYLYSSNKRWSKEIGPVKKGFTATLNFSYNPYATKGKGAIYVREKDGMYRQKSYGYTSNSEYLYYTIY